MIPDRKYDTLNFGYIPTLSTSGNTIAKIKKITITAEIIRLDFLLCHENITTTSLLTERILYMKFPLFASFIVFIIWLTYQLHKHDRIDEATKQSFWEKERRANSTRRKPLDDLPYIKIPYESLHMNLLPGDEKADDYKEIFRSLSESQIVNFTGITNTDLKLQYGAPNIDLLTRYDQNFTVLVRTLHQWASYLYEKAYVREAREILELAVSVRTDVSGSYKLLCQIYKEENTPEKIKELYPTAESLNSIMKNTIVRILQEAEQ